MFDLTLLKAEVQKSWGRPIFELALFLIFFMTVSSVQTMYKVTILPRLQSTYVTLVADDLVWLMSSQLLPLVIFCGLLASLSFAQDYEQGVIQTLFSLPVSRGSIFVVKFVAVVVPLTLLSWGATVFVMLLNYSSTVANTVMVFQQVAWALPITFLAVTFYAGLAAVISLTVKRALHSALITILTGFFIWFVTKLPKETIGALAEYLIFTPYKAPIVALGRVVGVTYPETGLENALPAWGFLVLILFYALVLLVPMYIYFTRKFEVKE